MYEYFKHLSVTKNVEKFALKTNVAEPKSQGAETFGWS
jgi:hypothetical protein